MHDVQSRMSEGFDGMCCFAGSRNSDPGWREFQTDEPNRKLLRQTNKAAAGARSPKTGGGQWLSLMPALPPVGHAWGSGSPPGGSPGDLDVSGRSMARPRKLHLPAGGSAKHINTMQMLRGQGV
eukprot:scaffold668221_cov37-Prasinocladus_malaysianus.AAC.1